MCTHKEAVHTHRHTHTEFTGNPQMHTPIHRGSHTELQMHTPTHNTSMPRLSVLPQMFLVYLRILLELLPATPVSN